MNTNTQILNIASVVTAFLSIIAYRVLEHPMLLGLFIISIVAIIVIRRYGYYKPMYEDFEIEEYENEVYDTDNGFNPIQSSFKPNEENETFPITFKGAVFELEVFEPSTY